MPAILNLRLTPTSAPDPQPEPAGSSRVTSADTTAVFTNLLQSRIDSALPVAEPGGQFLPEHGNELPLQIPIGQAAQSPQEVPLTIDARDPATTLLPHVVGEVPEVRELPETAPIEQVLAIPVVAQPYPAIISRQAGSESLPEQALGRQLSAIDRPGSIDTTLKSAARDGLNPTSTRRADVSREAEPTRIESVPRTKPLPPAINRISTRIADPELEVTTRSRDFSVAVPKVMALPDRGRRSLPETTYEATAQTGGKTRSVQRLTGETVVPPIAVEKLTLPERSLAPQTQFVQPSVQIHAPGITPVSTAQSTAPLLNGQVAQVINTPVQDVAWGEQITERVLLIAAGQQKSADIRLTPAELGPLRVQISIDDGATNVTFHALHSVTREAIEQALPRLREMLAENGLSLGQANVAEQGIAEGRREHESETTTSPVDAHEDDGESTGDETPNRQEVVTANSLIDTFA